MGAWPAHPPLTPNALPASAPFLCQPSQQNQRAVFTSHAFSNSLVQLLSPLFSLTNFPLKFLFSRSPVASTFPNLRDSLSGTAATPSLLEPFSWLPGPCCFWFSSSPQAALSYSCLRSPHPLHWLDPEPSPEPFPLLMWTVTFVSALWLTRCTGPSHPSAPSSDAASPERLSFLDQTLQSSHSLPCHCVMLPCLLLSSTLSPFVNLVDLGICLLVYIGTCYPEALPVPISLGLTAWYIVVKQEGRGQGTTFKRMT